jgi:hypothetical protein
MALSGEKNHAGVEISHLGNLDSRILPRVKSAEDQYSSQSSSLYFTAGKVDDVAAKLRGLFAAAGWQEYDQAFSQKAVRPDAVDLLFRKKGYSVSVSISKSPANPGKTAVQYGVETLARDMPAPADAKGVEIADSRWILKCEIPGDKATAAAFYRKAMPEIGFTAPPYETTSGTSMSLSFESPGHDLVIVSLGGKDARGTKVELEGYTAAFREAMKKAEADEKAKHEAETKAEEADKAARKKAMTEEFKKQDEAINAAVDKAMKGATDPAKQSDLSKEIQADVKAKLDEALGGRAADTGAKPAEPKK